MDGDSLLSATANPSAGISSEEAALAAQYLPAPTPGVVGGQGAVQTTNFWPNWETACAPHFASVSNVGNQDSPPIDPERVFLLGNCPHSWLFKRMGAVVHHGGAGTTAAGLQVIR